MSQDIYVIIGNTDGKLLKDEWRHFQADVKTAVESAAEKVWGTWYSNPNTPYQNMCVGFLLSEANTASLKTQLQKLAARYHQNSIAWSIAMTIFIRPEVNITDIE